VLAHKLQIVLVPVTITASAPPFRTGPTGTDDIVGLEALKFQRKSSWPQGALSKEAAGLLSGIPWRLALARKLAVAEVGLGRSKATQSPSLFPRRKIS
jgi:hypothetical protein